MKDRGRKKSAIFISGKTVADLDTFLWMVNSKGFFPPLFMEDQNVKT